MSRMKELVLEYVFFNRIGREDYASKCLEEIRCALDSINSKRT